MNTIDTKNLEEKKQFFSEFLNSNCKKLNLLKNFNHIIKEIIEKDLDLTVNVVTVNTLKNEFLADLPSPCTKHLPTSEDKENIDSSNIGKLNAPRDVEDKNVCKIKKKEAVIRTKNNCSKDYYPYSYNYQHQPKKFNPYQNRNNTLWKEKPSPQFSQVNQISSVQNTNSYFNKKENLNLGTRSRNSPTENQEKNRNSYYAFPQEKRIYKKNVECEEEFGKANM